jgi:hypothetical protein
MNTTNSTSFDELDAYLTARQRGEPADSARSQSIEQAAMLDALVELARRTQPDPAFAKALGQRLAVARSGKAGIEARERKPFFSRVAVYAVLGSALLIILGATTLFVLNRIRPEPTAVVMLTTGTIEPVATEATVQPTPLYTLFPTPALPPALPSLAQAMGLGFGGGGGGLFPGGVTYVLGTALPAGPGDVTAYFRQANPPITLDETRRIAAQWKLNAQFFMTPGVAELPLDSTAEKFFFAFDGMRQLVVESSTANYQDTMILPGYGGHQYPQAGLPPVEQAQATAIDFLSSRGLLSFPYSIGINSYDYGIVNFYRMMDGWRLNRPTAWVQVNPQSQVTSAAARTLNLEPVGTYPILSAQEAWEILTTDMTSERLWRSITPTIDGNPKFWGRAHPAGQTAHLFGPLDYLLLPADPGGNPRVSLNNLVLEGDLPSLIQYAQSNPGYFHVWGLVQESSGRRSLQMAGWESFDEFTGYFNGYISRQADGDFLVLADGNLLKLTDLPADLPDGEPVYVNGGLVGDTLEWFIIQVHPASEGQNPPTTISGEALINQVELIYLEPGESMPSDLSQDPAYKMLQPVWCFKGQVGTDYSVVIYVQAVR